VIPEAGDDIPHELVTAWGERIVINIPPPNPDVPLDRGPYFRIEARCGYHECNRLYPMTERTKLFCSPECQEANKAYRRKTSTAAD
jgi:hypothetical protein